MFYNIIPEERFIRYMLATGHNQSRALDLYAWNIQISEAFFPILCASEIALRDRIADRLRIQFGDTWWESSPFLTQIQRGKSKVLTARDNLAKRDRLTSGRMIAELTFGFWVNMTLPRHEAKFWRGFHTHFKHLPKDITYDDFHNRCRHIGDLRNRIFHHEPIFGRDLTADYSKTLQLIAWLNPDKAAWIKPYSRVMYVLRQKP